MHHKPLPVEQLHKLYTETTKTIKRIAEEIEHPFSRVYTYIRDTYPRELQIERKRVCYRLSKLGEKNPMLGISGEIHPSYKGDISDCKGYVLVLKPAWYTGRKKSKHIFKHHIVVCEHMGITEIPEGYCVHHIDKNPLNNNITNLVMLTNAEHSRIHAADRHNKLSEL